MINDYLTRTTDILALSGQKETGEALLTMSFAGVVDSGEICTGIQKLTQRYVLRFLKKTGSDLFAQGEGTEFMTRVDRGELRNSVDALVAFSEAQLDLRKQLRAEELSTDPDDERFDRAEIQSLAVLPGNLKLYIRLYSRAGDSRELILPISITVR